MSHGPCGDQSVQHPADRAIVHSGSPYPSPCRGIWGIEAALRSLSQSATPAAVMLAAASSQEERHRLGRLPSPLGGGSLHPDWRPRDMNCGAGSCRQVMERREGRNVQSVKDSQLYFRCGRGGFARTPVSPVLAGWLSAGIPLLSGHTGGEAGCLSLTRVSQASATISCVIALSADDDEATARSLRGRMASATLRRPISCSSVAAASRPSLVLGDSSVFLVITMSRPGVWGNDVTGDATGPTSVIRSPDTTGPNSCWSGDSSGCSWPEGTTTTDQSDDVGSRSSSLSWR